MTTIPFYDTLGPDTTTYILNQTELETIVVSSDLVRNIKHLKKNNAAG
jgi:long-subunit acyl-CoA synthetase (AMP-forming)